MFDDIQLVTFNKIKENLYEIVPEPPSDPGHLTGKEVLAQEVVKRMFTLAGSNALNPEQGSLFPRVISETSDVQINIAFKLIEDQVKTDQEGLDLPSEQLLESIQLDEIKVFPEEALVEVFIRVVNVLGAWIGFVIKKED